CSGRQHPNYGAMRRREQEPSTPSIENAFAKIKHWMRAAQKRTVDDTWRHIGHLVSTIEPNECRNYFANAGYASVKI
ncbi:hypothetical protein NKJ52_31700, partial [Mesorhizobium australicum]